jgi:hypothetical protein
VDTGSSRFLQKLVRPDTSSWWRIDKLSSDAGVPLAPHGKACGECLQGLIAEVAQWRVSVLFHSGNEAGDVGRGGVWRFTEKLLEAFTASKSEMFGDEASSLVGVDSRC